MLDEHILSGIIPRHLQRCFPEEASLLDLLCKVC